MRSDSKNV